MERDWSEARSLTQVAGEAEGGTAGYATVVFPFKVFLLQIAKFENAGESIEPFRPLRAQFAEAVTQSGDAPELLSALGLLDVWLGNGTLGVQEAERAEELLPVSQDPIDGPDLIANLALAYAWAGKKDQAFEQLTKYTQLMCRGNLDYGFFLLDPAWDPLRTDPRYAQILAKLKPSD